MSKRSDTARAHLRAANLEDIAKKAGVSRSTVSRVINNHPYVRAETRAKVERVITEEGFSPNPAARTLVTQRTRTIGIVIPHILNAISGDDAYFSTLLRGITEVTSQRDHATLLWLEHSEEDEKRFRERVLKNRMMDGLIIASATCDDPLFEHLLNTGTPFLTVERPVQFTEHISYVTVDNRQAARDAVKHLIDHGHRRIATITGNLNISDGEDRLAGYREAFQSAGLPIDPELVIPAKFNRIDGYNQMRRLIERTRDFDAVFAGNDAIALGVMQALNEANMRVPEDVAVIGFDDLHIALQVTPQLTTVHQPIYEKGAAAAHLLLDLIEGRIDSPQRKLLPTTLVVRQSCGSNPAGSQAR